MNGDIGKRSMPDGGGIYDVAMFLLIIMRN